MQRAPVAGAASAIRDQATATLDHQAGAIAEQWLQRLQETVCGRRPDLCDEALRDAALAMVHGIAEALRRAQPGEADASWTQATREHARIRQSQGAPLSSLLQEFFILRRELWPALGPILDGRPRDDALALEESVDSAFATMIGLSADTYGTGSPRAGAETELPRRALSSLESITDGFLIVDQEWRLTYANPEVERFLGRNRNEALGQSLWAAFSEMIGSPFDVQLHRALQEQVAVHFEALCPRLGLWVEVHAYPSDGGLAVYCQGISERKRIEAEREGLRAEAERRAAELDAVVSSAANAVLIYDAQGRIQRVNAEAQRVLGYRLTEREQLMQGWMGTRVETVDGRPFPPEDAPLVRAQRGETVHGIPAVIRQPLHAPVWISASAAQIRTPAGENLGVVVTAADVTALHELQEETLRLLEDARRARAEAEAAQAHLGAVLQQMPSGVIIAEAPSGRLCLSNEQAAHILGQPIQALAGVEQYPSHCGFHPDGRPYRPEEWPLARSVRMGEAVRDEIVDFLRPDGSRGTMSISSAPVRNRDGHIVAAVAVLADISERKQAEDALRKAKEYAEHLIETANVMVVGLDAQGRIRVFNSAAEEITGYSRDDLQGKNWFEVLVPRERYPEVWEMFSKAVSEGTLPRTFENPIVTKQGEERYILFRNSVLHQDGAITGTISFGIDITESKRTEEEGERLRDEAERRAAELDSTISSVADALIIYDAQGNIVRMNAEAERQLGHGPAERRLTMRERAARVQTADGRPLRVEDMPGFRALHGETVRGVTMQVRPPGREPYWVTASAAPIRGADSKIIGAVVTATDVTPLRRLQEQTDRLLGAERQAREQAEAAVRARDGFLAAAAHELKTPVTSLWGYAQTTIRQLAREEPPDPERVRQALTVIDRQSERLARLVQQLLDVASIETGQLQLHREETDLVPLVRRLVERIQASTRRHTMAMEAPASVPGFVDSRRIKQVVANLLDNATKFSPEGTPIEISLSTPEPGKAQLSVRDYGPGVQPELRPQLFNRFFQAPTAEPFAGLGLGLYYSRRIVELHGGHISAEFPEDGGSRFVVELPAGVTDQGAA